MAAVLIKAFAGSDHIAGTVITHLISAIPISNPCFTFSNRDCCRYLIDSENTTKAGIDFPFSVSMKNSWSFDY